MLGIVATSVLTKGLNIRSCMGLVVIIEAHDVLRKFCILEKTSEILLSSTGTQTVFFFLFFSVILHLVLKSFPHI